MPKTNRTPKKAQRIKEVHSAPVQSDIPGSFQSPESSTISQGVYDSSTQTLRIYFKRANGREDCYIYNKFPSEVWADFVNAESKGRFFQMCVRPSYAGRLLNDA